MRERLDKTDLKIIRLLQNDGRMASSEIAKTINELHELLSQIEIIDGVIRVETAFIRRIVRERFDFGTPKYLNGSENGAYSNNNKNQS